MAIPINADVLEAKLREIFDGIHPPLEGEVGAEWDLGYRHGLSVAAGEVRKLAQHEGLDSERLRLAVREVLPDVCRGVPGSGS